MSTGGGKSTTTTQLDPTVKPFVKYALEQGQQQYQQRKGGVPQYSGQTVAGFGPDVQSYFGGVRDLDAGVQGMQQAGQAVGQTLGGLQGMQGYEAAQFDPNRLNAQQIQEYMNPFQQQAIDAAVGGIQRRQGEEAAALRTRQAGAGALGNSRAAIESALQDREYRQLAADTEAKMLAEGFDRATALAVGQQQAERQAAIDTEQSRQFAQQSDLDRAAAELNAAQQMGLISQAERDMEIQRLEGLRGIGSQQQMYEQALLDEEYKRFIEERDRPKQELADYAAIAYGAPTGSQTSQSQPSSLGSTIAGLGMYALGSPWVGTALGVKDGGIMDIYNK
jgi:hypothetical protein